MEGTIPTFIRPTGKLLKCLPHNLSENTANKILECLPAQLVEIKGYGRHFSEI